MATVALGTTAPVSAMAQPATAPQAGGYWLVARDGGIFSFGDAHFYGSNRDLASSCPSNGCPPPPPVVAMAPTPDGGGYWLAFSTGFITSFGNAQQYGGTEFDRLSKPIVGIAATPDGKGYWLAAADGGVFAFGDAGFYGSMGGQHLNAPVDGIAATPGP